MSDTREEKLAKLEELAHDVAGIRSRMPSDSPLQKVAFDLHVYIGELQAKVASLPRTDSKQ